MNRDSRRLRLVLALLLLTSATLLTLDLRGGRGGAFGAVRDAVGGVFAPVGDAVHGLTAPVGRAFQAATHSGRDGRTIDRLERENGDLKRRIDADTQAKADYEALRRLQYQSFRTQAVAVGATVTQRGSADGIGEQTVQINIGRDQGVALGNVVVDGTAVIGSVKRVTARAATVLLITDRSSTIGLETQRGTRALFTASGQGPGRPLRFTYADVSTQLRRDQPVGTILLQTDNGGIDQVQGAYVGTITTVDAAQGGVQQTGTIAVAADTEADVVAVLTDQQHPGPRVALPRESPPAPTPAPPPAPRSTRPPTAPPAPPAGSGARPSRPAGATSSAPSP